MQVITGRTAASPRWRKCVAYVNGQLGLALGRMYVKEKFDKQAKRDVSRFGTWADVRQGKV